MAASSDQHRAGIGMTSQRTRDRLVERLRERGITDERVLEAMAMTPRHLFVDEALSSRAYEDTALPIGQGQTISQPYVVARMTEALIQGKAGLGKVLELGTGSGYQTAILAQLAEAVWSVERIRELARTARRRFQQQGLHNVLSRHDDGRLGWPSQAPFDGIMVTAAASHLADELVGQLSEGARLIAPVGSGSSQRLLQYIRTADGIEKEDLGGVVFVPLLGGTA